MFGLVYSGIALFNQSILEQRGFDAKMYHTVLAVSTLIGLGANFGGGWLASRWPIQRLTGVGMGVLAASLLMLPFVSTFAHVMAYATAMGVAGGVVTVVFFSVWAQVFGRTELGRIQGFAQMMTVLASAIGPLLLAAALKGTGSYSSIFLILAGIVASLGVASWRVSLPGASLCLAAALCRHLWHEKRAGTYRACGAWRGGAEAGLFLGQNAQGERCAA
jgi:MFS family permease